ncbi:hypothetical protein F0U59_39175 [Archangium gephyra]|nr:hypothetical protein F0U59_39175 [Archangium gephyra]
MALDSARGAVEGREGAERPRRAADGAARVMVPSGGQAALPTGAWQGPGPLGCLEPQHHAAVGAAALRGPVAVGIRRREAVRLAQALEAHAATLAVRAAVARTERNGIAVGLAGPKPSGMHWFSQHMQANPQSSKISQYLYPPPARTSTPPGASFPPASRWVARDPCPPAGWRAWPAGRTNRRLAGAITTAIGECVGAGTVSGRGHAGGGS